MGLQIRTGEEGRSIKRIPRPSPRDISRHARPATANNHATPPAAQIDIWVCMVLNPWAGVGTTSMSCSSHFWEAITEKKSEFNSLIEICSTHWRKEWDWLNFTNFTN